MIKTAVVILNWNGRHFLEKFLPSVVRYSAMPGVRIVVADNGSTDDSVIFLKNSYPDIGILQFDRNRGFAEGYNLALKQIEAEYYILLNSDVEVTESWIEPVIDFMDSDKGIAACMPKIKDYHRQKCFEYAGAAGGYIDTFGYIFCRGRIFNIIEDDKGQYITADSGAFAKDSFGHVQLGGIAEMLKAIIEKEVKIKARWNKLGTNQRSAMHFASLTDVKEAYMCGKMAVKYALQGVNSKMVTLVREKGRKYKCTTGLAELRDVANGEKKVPREFINEKGNHITKAMRDYVKPLVQGQAPVKIGEDGLPVFMRFERKPLAKKLPKYI